MLDSRARTALPLMATVNGVIDQLHGSFGLPDSDFFCECGQFDCKERIKLTRTEYADLRDDDRAVLVAEHASRGAGVAADPRGLRLATRASQGSGDPHGR